MKILRIGVTLGIITSILLAPILVLADTWEFKFPIYITDNSSVTRSYYPVIIPNGIDSISSFTPTGMDTNMQSGGTDVRYMITNDKIITVVPTLPANGRVTHDLYTGYSPSQTTFPIITGASGYVTVTDAATLEPSANYSFKWNGIRFSTWSANLTDKTDTLNVNYSPTTGNVTLTVAVTENVTPPNYTEQDAGGFLAEVGDNVTYTAMTSQTDAYLYKDFGAGYFNAIDIRWVQYVQGDAVNPFSHAGIGVTNTLNDITGLAATDLWATSQVWNAAELEFRVGRGNLVSSNSTGLLPYANQTINHRLQRSAGSDLATYSIYTESGTLITSRTITGLGASTTYRYILVALNYNSGTPARFITGSIANIRFITETPLNVAVSNTADHDIEVTSNATSVGIRVDGGAWSTNATVTIPDTTSNWNFISNVPYVDNITMSVGGNPKLHYEPNAAISGTTLPDRATADGTQNGIITWGTNANIELSYGAIIYNGSTSVSGTLGSGYVAPDMPMPSRWFGAYGLTPAVADATFVDAWGYAQIHQQYIDGGIPTLTVYASMFIALAFLVFLFLAVKTNSLAAASGGAIMVLFAGSQVGTAGAIPLWLPTIGLFLVLAVIFSYKQIA